MSTGPLSPQQRFAAIPTERINAALGWEDPETLFDDMRQPRDGEELQGIAIAAQVRALHANDWFWEFNAEVFPNNDILCDERTGGAPQHFPDWFLFLLDCVAGIAGIGTHKRAVDYFSDERTWKDFVADVDAYVPDGMTRLRDLPCRKPNKEHPPKAKPGTKKSARTKARARNHEVVVPLRPRPLTDPPTRHHLNHFKLRWRGLKKVPKQGLHPIPVGDPDYGMRERAVAAFRRLAVDQALAMGILHPEAPWLYRRPDRNACAGADGVVFPFSTKRALACAAYHTTGEGKRVYGSKFMLVSARVNGQYLSRLMLDYRHIHKDHPGSFYDESRAVLDSLPALRELSRDGLRVLLVDSAVRGQAVTELQRQGITVANYPHAASNPDGGPGKRLNPSRVEKSRLRLVYTHTDRFGLHCEHPIYAVGGELIEVVTTADGTDAPRHLIPEGHDRRGRPGKYRDYLNVVLDCKQDKIRVRVPLFHNDGPSTAPDDTNWGEVCRLYGPGSPQFKYLYGARNDTEARHADIKARVKHLPRDVPGQELRFLGAFMAINAIAWQVHLQAHGEPNVFDDTA